MTTNQPRLVISPQRPRLDTELRIRFSGVAPGRPVTLRAGQPGWACANTFVPRADGTVDTHRDAPVDGTYDGVDPMGVIWSMRPAPATGPPGGPRTPVVLTVEAEVDGSPVASARVARLRVPDGLIRTELREHGLVGVRYRPDDDRVLPGVLLLGGSEGGLHEDDAALLAAHGYTVLALAYHGLPGVPAALRDIPLEYFERALDHVGDPRPVVIGGSKGGEAALLIGATFPRVRGVVSLVGGGLVTAGISQPIATGSFLDIIATSVPSWTHHGRPLPYAPNVVTPELTARVAAGVPVALRLAFEPVLADPDVRAAATIPVERVHGPVLLISGEDDQGYGPAVHEVAARRLAGHGHRYPWEHVVQPGAGHLIAAAPYGPTTMLTTPAAGVTLAHGGTPAANARARADTWRRVLRFLAG